MTRWNYSFLNIQSNNKMKKLIVLPFFFAFNISFSQTFNWKNLDSAKPTIYYASANLEHGLSATLGSSYRFKKIKPLLVFLDLTIPAGKKILDDFKVRIGGKTKLIDFENFVVSAAFSAIYRRYESDFVRMQNFGSEASATAGYFRKKWFVAGEFGFDKAIITQFKHKDNYKLIFPDVKDGWYEPSAGGIFNYGLQGGFSLRNADITINAGKLITQDFKTNPTIPFYVKFGFNLRVK